MLGLALLLASSPVEPPTTVNGDMLGQAKDFRTDGPARVCIRNMAVDAHPGEAIYLHYAGIHIGSLRLVIGDRYVDLAHGEIWAKPKGFRRLIERTDTSTIYRIDEAGSVRYVAYGLDSTNNGKEKPLIMITGTALEGRKTDLALLARMTLAKSDFPGCDRTYSYGWDMLLGDEETQKSNEERGER